MGIWSYFLNSYHQYTIKCKNRQVVIDNLKNNEIGFGIYYPKPLHHYNHLGQYGHSDLVNSENISNEVLSLPVHPALTDSDIGKIINVINGVSQQL